jgi:3-oxoacyl-[acyl-carrier-protein] synthase II
MPADVTSSPRDAVITGIGLASCLGEGTEAHWAALNRPGGFVPVVDSTSFAPLHVHPIAPLNLDGQIPKKGDQRQMEAWQRIGTYAAGLALDAAGLKGDAERLTTMHMMVAAGGGERDQAADEALLTTLRSEPKSGGLLNRRLMSDLRPTLFLAQLSNLLAGNISIVHGVVGSSRTFMGEEASGIEAVRIACARIFAGQGDLFLVGGAYNAQRPEALLEFEMGASLLREPFAGVWARQESGGGMALASLGCFLVIESREHAAARGATPQARIAAVSGDRCARHPGQATANAQRQLAGMRQHLQPGRSAIISAASGAAAPTREEHAFLRGLDMPYRGIATAVGHSLEPAFPMALALGGISLAQGRLFAPLEAEEAAMTDPLRSLLVTGWGHWRSEGMAVLDRP